MSTWLDVYGGRIDGDPVRAYPEPFSGESTVASTTATNIDFVTAQFREIRAGRSDGFEGATATAIANQAVDWQARLEPAAGVFRDVARVLADHADHLSTLHSDASFAAAQALAAWKLKKAAESRLASSSKDLANAQGSVAAADHNVAWIKTQIAAISPGSPDAQFRLPKLMDEERNWQTERSHRIGIRNNTQGQVEAANRDLSTADRELDYWYNGDPNRSWQRLRHREDDLNNATARRIHDIGLSGVANPGWMGQHVSDFVDFVRHAVDTIEKAVEAAVKAFIEAVTILLVAIVVIVAVVVAIVALVALIYAAVVIISAIIGVVIEVGVALLRLLPLILEVFNTAHRMAHTSAWAVFVWNHYLLRHHPPNANPDLNSYPGRMIDQITAAHGDPNKLMDPYHRHLLELAALAAAPDGGSLPPGFHSMSAADLGIDPGLLDNPMSGFHAAVFRGPNGEIIVGFGNSQSGNDWLTNISDTEIGGWAIPGSQERQAMALARLLYQQHPGNVVFTGHSLGGDLATIASYATGGSPAVTFNAKGTNLDNLMTMDSAWSPSETKSYAQTHIVAYRTTDDPLSNGQEYSPLPDALGNPVVLDRGVMTPADIFEMKGHFAPNLREAMDQYPVLKAGAPSSSPAGAPL